jgi:hypothetical protein
MSDIERINLIQIDILKTKIFGVDNHKLIHEILNTRGEIDETYLEDKHHTYYEDKRYPFGHIESEKLIDKLTERVSSAIGREMILSDIWTLTLEYGQSVASHSHKSNTHLLPEEYFSIAYYPSAPEGSADLIFLANAANTIDSSIVVKPENGDLIIFNSYLTHMTNRHRNKTEPRIVVSANFVPKNPNVTPTQDWSAYNRDGQLGSPGYERCYSLKVLTPFGKEDVILGIKGNVAEIFNTSGKYFIDKFTETNNSFEAKFPIDTPMVAEVHILLSIDSNLKTIQGTASIGEYANYSISGVFS